MKAFACAVLVLFLGAVMAQHEPKTEGKKETALAISLADRGGAVAEWIRIGSLVNIVVEEPAAPPRLVARTVFEGCRVSAVAEDKREKDGLTVTVNVTPAQAKAFEALKGAGKVKVERHPAGSYLYRPDKDKVTDKDKR